MVGTAGQAAYIYSCYYLCDSASKINTGIKGVGESANSQGQSASGLSASAMTKTSSFKDGDFTSTWMMEEGVNEGRPILRSLKNHFQTSSVTADKASGTYQSDLFVRLEGSEEAIIYYTTDGTTPTTDSMIYVAPITINKNTELQFMAKKSGFKESDTVKKTYKIRTPKAKVNKKSGAYKKKVTVKFTVPKGASVYYTTDGTNPTTKSKKYKKGIVIKKTTTLRFITVKKGCVNSEVGIASYRIKK